MQDNELVRHGNNMQRSYLDVLGEHMGFVMIFCMSAILTTVLLTYIYSDKYESSASVFYQPLEVTRYQGANTQALGSPVPAPPFKIVGKTLEEVLLSSAILEPIVDKYGLYKNVRNYSGPWYSVLYKKTKDTLIEYAGYGWSILKYGRILDKDPRTAALERLRGNVKIKNKDSYIFHILVRDKSPERSTLIANDLAQGLVVWLKEQAKKPSVKKLEQIESLLGSTVSRVSKSTLDIQKLLEANNIASIEAEIERSTISLSELELDKVAIDKKVVEQRARLSMVERKIQLKSNALTEIDSQSIPGKRDHIQPDDLRRLKSKKIVLQVELTGALAERASLAASIRTLREKIGGLPLMQNKISRYEIDLKAAKEDYGRLNESYQEALVRATGDVSEAKFLNIAVVPTIPVAPIKVYHVALAALLSLFVSIGLVYLFSYYNVRVFFPSQGVAGRIRPVEKNAVSGASEGTSKVAGS